MSESARDQTRAMLLVAATRLAPLLDRLVFVGGATTGLFLTDLAAPDIRATKDVDVIVEVASRLEYRRFEQHMREIGFRQDPSRDWPVCRWTDGQILVDLMPTREDILGFSNRWYSDAVREAQWVALAADLDIRVVSAPYFIGTKLEAFLGRGEGDYLASPDVEDIIAVLDGRSEIVVEIEQAESQLRDYVARAFQRHLENGDFLDALPGHLVDFGASAPRATIVLERMAAIAELRPDG